MEEINVFLQPVWRAIVEEEEILQKWNSINRAWE